MELLHRDHLEFVQQEYREKKFNSTTFERSDIDNCELTALEFQNCRFDRSSLTCIRAQHCIFKTCQFRNVDFLSCNLTDCIFHDCDFSLANIEDNVFHSCRFTQSNFTGAMLRENEFLNTEFENISLRGSATCLNTFRKSVIQNSEFGNCTVDYNILEDCSFQNTFLNIETLGTFFGLDLRTLSACQFLSLGEQSLEPDLEALFVRIRRLFETEGRYIEVFIIDLNHSLNHLYSKTETLCTRIQEKILAGRYIPSDQLKFLFNVFKELYRRKQLGLLPLGRLMDGIKNILALLPPEDRSYEKFVLFYNNLNLLYNSITVNFIEDSDWSYYMEDRPIIIRFKFQKCPSLPIDKLLRECHIHVFGNEPEKAPIVLLEQTGSYIVYVEAAIYSLLAFRICAYLLVGGVKDLVKLRANLSLLTSKKLPRKYYLEATKLETESVLPSLISTLMPGLLKKKLAQAIADLPLEEICEGNLSEIQEVTKDTVPTAD